MVLGHSVLRLATAAGVVKRVARNLLAPAVVAVGRYSMDCGLVVVPAARFAEPVLRLVMRYCCRDRYFVTRRRSAVRQEAETHPRFALPMAVMLAGRRMDLLTVVRVL